MEKIRFSKYEREILDEELYNFLRNKSWKKKEYSGKSVYLKEKAEYPPINFLDKPAKKNLSPPESTIKEIERFFLDRSYIRKVEDKIVTTGKVKDTFLIGSGIQCFRECFWSDKEVPKGNYFIPQPVIRMKSLSHIGEGNTSSFVNISTVKLQCIFKDHLEYLNRWFDLFSRLGLYIGDFSLGVIPADRYALGKKGNWQNTDGFSISINYLNLNIGDAGFIRIPTPKGPLEVSDIGFGLERILWSIYKTPSYFDLIGPEEEVKNSRAGLVDSVRSATLLCMSNIHEADSDSYRQFKKFIRIAAKDYSRFDTFRLINHYHAFWSRFIIPQRNTLETYYLLDKVINGEITNGAKDSR